MDDEPATQAAIRRLRRVANYQFGRGAGAALLPDDGAITVTHTSSGRVEQCFDDGERLFTKATDGRFVLSVAGGRRLVWSRSEPRHYVEVGEESVPFVRDGKNAFAKFVQSVDPGLRPGDEAVVVHDGAVLGVGRAELPAAGMEDFETGVAVHVRHGASD